MRIRENFPTVAHRDDTEYIRKWIRRFLGLPRAISNLLGFRVAQDPRFKERVLQEVGQKKHHKCTHTHTHKP
jgi:hypothetical protein